MEDNTSRKETDKLENSKPQPINPKIPDTIPKFIDSLPIPGVAQAYGTLNGKNYYEITMLPTSHKFHRFFPPALVWGYNGMVPGPTFQVLRDQSIYVKWINNLPLKHFLPVDKTLHGAIDTPEVRTVVHLHGANVAPHSDGHPEAWFTPGYSVTGKKFEREVYEYTNHQQASTFWYHDHAIGTTRLNVYAGLAGFYLIRDTLEKRLKLPSGEYEIPLMIQDKSFNEDGSLFYPELPPFPVTVKPSVVPAFIGNTIVVNGKVWPYLKVEPRKYRFRILNASNTRGYTLGLSNGQPFYQIGTDGGLLEESVELTSIELEPAERADIIIDFKDYKGQKITLNNTADTSPNTGVVMQFVVEGKMRGEDFSEIPKELYPKGEHLTKDMAKKTRSLSLSAGTDDYNRPMLLLNKSMWHDPATEKPAFDSIEMWRLINATAFPHPVHVHLVQFKILDRRPFNVQRYLTDNVIEFTGPKVEPREFEKGWKDVVKAEPGMITRIIMHFKDQVGDFVWHCHILEHEDHDMMRPFRVIEDSNPV